MGGADKLALSVHAGADGAAERLVRSYQDQLFNYALRLLRDPMDAQEVTQDAFIRAIKALTQQYDAERCGRLALRPWLFRIARNLAYNRGRARRRVPEEPLEVGFNGHESALLRARRPQQDQTSCREMDVLDAALRDLTAESRELVFLRFMEEMSYAEIAATVGSTAASARAKVFRALRRLRGILSRMENQDAL